MARTIAREYVSPAEVADRLGIHERTVRRRIADGTLPAYRVGPRHIRIAVEDVDKLLDLIPTVDEPTSVA